MGQPGLFVIKARHRTKLSSQVLDLGLDWLFGDRSWKAINHPPLKRKNEGTEDRRHPDLGSRMLQCCAAEITLLERLG